MALIGREGSGMQGLALAMKFQCSRHLYRTQKNRNSPVDLQLKSRWLNNKFIFGLKKIKLQYKKAGGNQRLHKYKGYHSVSKPCAPSGGNTAWHPSEAQMQFALKKL